MGSNKFKRSHAVYRGRTPRKKRILISIVILAILATIGMGVYYITQNYMVYTAEGFYFDFPFLNGKEKNPDESNIIEIGGDKNPIAPDVVPSTPDEEPVQAKTTQAISADIMQMADATYRAQIIERATQNGANAVALVIMDESGILNVPFVGEPIAGLENPKATEFLAGIKELQNANLEIIGMVSACRNNFGTSNNRNIAQQISSGKRWIDSNKIGWFKPEEQGTKDYIAEIIKSCKAAGLSEVILDNVSYPTNGQTNLIKTNPDINRAQAIADVISSAKAAAGSMKIGAMLTENAASLIEDTNGGQLVIMIAPVADSVITAAPTAKLAAAISDTNKNCRLISLVHLAQNPNDKTINYILQ